MLWALRQIATPVRYLRIWHGLSFFKSKAVYDWALPVVFTVPTVYVAMAYGDKPIFSENGIIGGFQKLLEILVPFFIAALAAVATFGNEALNLPMKGEPAVLRMKKADGTVVEHILTRRQFVCYLFGYLSFISLCLFVLILLFRVFGEHIGEWVWHSFGAATPYIKTIVLFVFLFPIWQMIVATLLGIYFVADRLQMMDTVEH